MESKYDGRFPEPPYPTTDADLRERLAEAEARAEAAEKMLARAKEAIVSLFETCQGADCEGIGCKWLRDYDATLPPSAGETT